MIRVAERFVDGGGLCGQYLLIKRYSEPKAVGFIGKVFLDEVGM